MENKTNQSHAQKKAVEEMRGVVNSFGVLVKSPVFQAFLNTDSVKGLVHSDDLTPLREAIDSASLEITKLSESDGFLDLVNLGDGDTLRHEEGLDQLIYDIQSTADAIGAVKDSEALKKFFFHTGSPIHTMTAMTKKQMQKSLDLSLDHLRRIATSELLNDVIISHHGVKGMKWGVRRDQVKRALVGNTKTGTAAGDKVLSKIQEKRAAGKAKAAEKQDEGDFKKTAYSKETYVKVYNATAKKMNGGELQKLNAKYAGKNLNDKKTYDSYISEHKSNFERIANAELSNALGGSRTSKSGKTKVTVVMNEETGYMAIVPEGYEMKHAESFEDMGFKLVFDDDGFIIRVEFEETVIEHYGIKGQKWGVRKESSKSGSSVKSMSNEQLQKEIKRMELERNYNRLKKEQAGQSKMSAGANKAKTILARAGEEAVKNYLSKQFGRALEVGVSAAVGKVKG